MNTLRYGLEEKLPGSAPLMIPSNEMLFISEDIWARNQSLQERGLVGSLDSLAH